MKCLVVFPLTRKTDMVKPTTRIVVPSGVIGISFDRKVLDKAVQCPIDIIAIDGGSTDNGPFYLGDGQSKYSCSWTRLLRARAIAKGPLVLASAGACGTDAGVD